MMSASITYDIVSDTNAFIAPFVPTGIYTGVRTYPCGSVRRPALHLPYCLRTLKFNALTISTLYRFNYGSYTVCSTESI